MKKRKVIISEDAFDDLSDLMYVIKIQYQSPNTAVKYGRELVRAMYTLESNAEIYAVQTRAYFNRFGRNVRRLNYKKMTVIYTIHGDAVYIHRIVAANTISGFSN
jgi:plasmid stabilization system protein ParE